MLLKDFKNFVDLSPAAISSADHIEVCNYLGIDITTGYSRDNVVKRMGEIIQESIKVESDSTSFKLTRNKIKKLESELVFRQVIYNDDSTKYLDVLRVLVSFINADDRLPVFSETDKWEKIVTCCKNYNIFSPSTYGLHFSSLRDTYPRDFDIATSVKELIDRGCKIEINDSNIEFVSGLEEVIEGLNILIKSIGGFKLAEIMFNFLEENKRYSRTLERFFITRRTDGLSYKQKPQIPFGFLFNLCLRHPFLNEEIKPEELAKVLKEIIDLSIIITNGVYGVQPYNHWEFHFKTGETIIQFCTEIALWDSMFSLPQCKPSTALEIASKIFSFIDDTDFEIAVGFSRDAFLSVANKTHEISSNITPSVIYLSRLAKELNHIPKDIILSILNFFSHSGLINEKYIYPSDYFEIDFYKRPLIKVGNTKFILMNKSWCSPNYFEAIDERLRPSTSNFDSKIGNQFEVFVQEKLKQKEIVFCTGKYKVEGIEGECDLLIETDKAIVLIELKKKRLTQNAKAGIDTNLLLDLAESMLATQLQLGRTEIILREKESIKLIQKDGESICIEHKNRIIERVSLSLLEFGAFHDRTIVNQFLKSLLTHSYNTFSSEPSVIERFNKLAENQKVWVEQYKKLYDIDEGFAHFPYFNCCFLSLPQFMEILNLSFNNNSFYETLTKNKHVSLSTLDWYLEFEIATKSLSA